MIGKSTKGRGFYGAFRYVLEEGEAAQTKNAHIIGGNLMGRNAKELSSEVREVRRIRPEIKKPVWHVSLSFPPSETVNDALMQRAGDRFLDEMGLDRDRHQHVYVRHHDKEHQHVHLVVNRISDEGRVFDLHNDYARIKATTRKLEKELGLQITPERNENMKVELKQRIANVAKEHPQLSDFCQRLEAEQITPVFTIRRGRLSGLSYRYQGMAIRGSQLGKEYSFQGLQRHHGIDYQPQRDDDIIRSDYVKYRKPGKQAKQEIPPPERLQPETPRQEPREPVPKRADRERRQRSRSVDLER